MISVKIIPPKYGVQFRVGKTKNSRLWYGLQANQTYQQKIVFSWSQLSEIWPYRIQGMIRVDQSNFAG